MAMLSMSSPATSAMSSITTSESSAATTTRSLLNIVMRVAGSTSSPSSASSMVPFDAVMRMSTTAPAVICSTRSPEALNCVSAKVTSGCSSV